MKLVNILLVLLLGIYLENDVVSGLKFAIQDSVKVDNPDGVIVVGKQTKFTCNYSKNRRETISVIRWFLSYENSNANFGNVFEHRVTAGQKINNAAGLSHITVFEDSGTEKDIDIKINDFKESPVTIKCEVEVQKDNGYGRISSHTKAAEKSFDVIEVISTTPGPTGEHTLHNDVHTLLEMIDPRRHAGVPYDHYSGYIVMVAKIPEIGSNGARSNYGYNNQQSTQSVQLFGQLPTDVIRELQTIQRTFQKVSDKKYTLEMEPVDVLNVLGNHGFRAIGSTSTTDQKIVWTLEQRDFENHI
jgi:hypothetical protein